MSILDQRRSDSDSVNCNGLTPYSSRGFSKSSEAKRDWSAVKAVKIWVLVRAEKPEDGFNTSSASGAGYDLGGFTIPDSDLNDGYRRLLLSNVVRMRNMDYDSVVSTTVTP